MASLYELTNELSSLLDAISEGEIPEEAIADTLEGLMGEVDEKIDSVTDAYKTLQAEAAMISAEEKRLSERRKRKESAAERIREYLSAELQKLGKAKHESARHALSFRSSKKVIVDEEQFKVWCADNNRTDLLRITTKTEPDKTAIGEALKIEEIPFVEIQVNQNIQIR